MDSTNFTGSQNASIYIVSDEALTVGAERILNRLLMDAGINIENCRVGWIFNTRPDTDKAEWYRDSVYDDYFLKCLSVLDEDIINVRPNVIVPLTNPTLRFIECTNKILLKRGSIYWNERYDCKVIPTVHPSMIMKKWDLSPLALFDWTRIEEESGNTEYTVPDRLINSNLSFEKSIEELDKLMKADKIAFDIETPISDVKTLTCIGFACSPFEALVIPFQYKDGSACFLPEEEIALMSKIKEVLESDVKKIAQNAQFDMGFLKYYYGINVKNLYIDTMCAQHTLYPELPKGLNVLCSLFTKQQYYKDIPKLGGGDLEFWKYNGLDACITYEAAGALEKDMKEFEVWDFYLKVIHPLIPVLMDMQLFGVKVDIEAKDKALEQLRKELIEQQAVLDKEVGHPINASSPTQLKQLLYKEMNLPIKTNRKTGKESTDENALKALNASNPSPIFDAILSLRGIQKIIGTYLEAPLCNNRLHTSYNIGGRIKKEEIISGPETGRLSSSRSIILNSGTNLQNVPKGICRSIIIPDEGKEIIKSDLSQAEARVVAHLSKEEKLIAIFNGKEDMYKQIACWIFNKSLAEITDDERDISKKMVHALNYGMGYISFSIHAKVSIAKAKLLTEKYFDTFYNIKEWQLEVQRQLSKTRIMTTPFGRKRQFFGRWGNPLFRQAYAYTPQSTVGDLLNLALCATVKKVKEEKLDVQPLLQVHDEFDLQSLPQDRSRVIEIIKESFKIPIQIHNQELMIPCEISVGKNWNDMEVIE